MNDNYITVTEFAKKAGFSKQYVYQNLDKRFKDYYRVINGKKVLDTAVFDAVSIREPQDLKDINIVQPNHDLVRQLQDQINTLKSQIETKDMQLAEKDKQIAEKDHQISDYAELLKAEQVLRMAADERLARLEDKHTEQDTQEPAQQDPVTDPLTVSRENPSKISFWERIRKRLH